MPISKIGGMIYELRKDKTGGKVEKFINLRKERRNKKWKKI